MWQLPLPLGAIACIVPDCLMAPLVMALQQTINKLGKIVDKWRFTHDQTYKPTLDEYWSINHLFDFTAIYS